MRRSQHDPVAIVEAAATGIEVECSVIGNDEPEVSEPGQVIAQGDWYDYESKYTAGGMELVVPAPISARAARARAAHRAGRVPDVLLRRPRPRRLLRDRARDRCC